MASCTCSATSCHSVMTIPSHYPHKYCVSCFCILAQGHLRKLGAVLVELRGHLQTVIFFPLFQGFSAIPGQVFYFFPNSVFQFCFQNCMTEVQKKCPGQEQDIKIFVKQCCNTQCSGLYKCFVHCICKGEQGDIEVPQPNTLKLQ